MHSRQRRGGNPPKPRASQCSFMTSYVCLASSLDGLIQSPKGPSPLAIGIFVSCSNAIITIGREKTRVFPEPVKAIPIISLPLRATGRPWTWMGVGRSMPLALSRSRVGFGNLMSLKSLIGGGTSSPSTMMCHFFLSLSLSSSVVSRRCLGGLQSVFIGSVYFTSLASSCTPIRAFFCERSSSVCSSTSSVAFGASRSIPIFKSSAFSSSKLFLTVVVASSSSTAAFATLVPLFAAICFRRAFLRAAAGTNSLPSFSSSSSPPVINPWLCASISSDLSSKSGFIMASSWSAFSTLARYLEAAEETFFVSNVLAMVS
mmetsp:Transcript_17986/g.59058  ORF Transcript_17986/g.59058 Transcript_17986/m.59058 type:complete len:316 (-) Transcript_17986:871-1818(-)